ncbi:hypothetical protein [Ornithinimicrobium sp. INDO-MA30-4]|uniref:hypothetical protein n=1 Tax=Ornithinimicrobium sp. INDO-MA30-4 TaxID=2908651 RepID=UPI001F3D4FDB|nr:hypothetical protein [Ornithinimicrobium sp. INDO-MA30-4]UJH71411.1 hypothetical protein L0A91_06730 [Ornithinimicrobium sp. INDO-MA30-4]
MFGPKTRRQWAVAGVAALSTTTVLAGSTMPALAAPIAVPAQVADGAEVFISEYVEGSSFNKGLEFFNPTDADIDLAAENYTVQVFSNGNLTASATVNLTGTIPAKARSSSPTARQSLRATRLATSASTVTMRSL